MSWVKRPPNPGKRLRKREQEVADLMTRGEYRGAFNHAAGALQAALSRDFRDHPGKACDRYAFYARMLLRFAAEVQSGRPIDDADLRRVGLVRQEPAPLPMAASRP